MDLPEVVALGKILRSLEACPQRRLLYLSPVLYLSLTTLMGVISQCPAMMGHLPPPETQSQGTHLNNWTCKIETRKVIFYFISSPFTRISHQNTRLSHITTNQLLGTMLLRSIHFNSQGSLQYKVGSLIAQEKIGQVGQISVQQMLSGFRARVTNIFPSTINLSQNDYYQFKAAWASYSMEPCDSVSIKPASWPTSLMLLSKWH